MGECIINSITHLPLSISKELLWSKSFKLGNLSDYTSGSKCSLSKYDDSLKITLSSISTSEAATQQVTIPLDTNSRVLAIKYSFKKNYLPLLKCKITSGSTTLLTLSAESSGVNGSNVLFLPTTNNTLMFSFYAVGDTVGGEFVIDELFALV